MTVIDSSTRDLKRVGNPLEGVMPKGYGAAQNLSDEDRRALEAAERSELELAEEIVARHALDRDIGFKGSENIRDRILSGLEHDPDRLLARVPARDRRRIQHAYEMAKIESNRAQGYGGWPPKGVPFFTVEDAQRTATDIWGDGKFYRGVITLPENVNLPIRVKRYGDPKKFERGAMVQRFLQRLERSGVIDQKINSPAYVDERNGLVVELHIGGRRLLDNLRDVKSDSEKADMLWPTIRDYLDISTRATRARDLRIDKDDAQVVGWEEERGFGWGDRKAITDEGNHYLKPRGNPLTSLRNILPWNYLVPKVGDPTDNAVKMFGLRAVPFLKNQSLDRKGRVKSSLAVGGLDPAVAKLSDGFSHLFHDDFSKRRKYLVNLDANTTQVLVTPDQRRVYTDWDHTYFGLLEEQLAENLLTSTITDESQLENLIGRAYEHVADEVGGTAEDWKRVVDKKMAEKLLGRAARFVEVARKIEDPKEERTLRDFANESYTLALKRIDKIKEDAVAAYKERAKKSSWDFGKGPTMPGQIDHAMEAIREFNDKYLHLKEVPIEGRLQSGSDTIGSIVSSVQGLTPLEGMKRDFRISGEPGKWRRRGRFAGKVAAAVPILAGLSYGTCRATNMNEIERIETAALYDTKDIAVVDPHTDTRFVLSGDNLEFKLPSGKDVDDLFAWAYGEKSAEESDLPINFIRDRVTPLERVVREFKEIQGVDPEDPESTWSYRNYVEDSAERYQVDPDLIRAAIIGNRFGVMGFAVESPERIGPMGLPFGSHFFDSMGYDYEALSIPKANINAGTMYLRQCGQANETELAGTLAEFYNGAIAVRDAKLKAYEELMKDRQKGLDTPDRIGYSDWRVHLPNEGMTRTDEAIGQYIQLKTRPGFFRGSRESVDSESRHTGN